MFKKILVTGFIISFTILISSTLSAQNKCKVLMKEISTQYHGKCKKGLAHGKGKASGLDTYAGHFKAGFPDGNGTYIWANGDSYTGEWKKGKRSGKGIFTIHLAKGDSVVKGLWKNDHYIGLAPPKPEVLYSNSIDRYTFKKSGDNKNRILIDVYQNGARNYKLDNLITYCSSGTKTNIGYSFGYEFITFPAKVKINYYTWNKLHTVQVYVRFEFIISEPGDWRVKIVN